MNVNRNFGKRYRKGFDMKLRWEINDVCYSREKKS